MTEISRCPRTRLTFLLECSMPPNASSLELLASFLIVFTLGVATRWLVLCRRPSAQPASFS